MLKLLYGGTRWEAVKLMNQAAYPPHPEVRSHALAGPQPGWLSRLWPLRRWPDAPRFEEGFAEFVVANLGADKTFADLARFRRQMVVRRI